MTELEVQDLKRFFSRDRLMALAVAEGVQRKGWKLSCPDTGCAGVDKPDSCSLTDKDTGCVWHCHRGEHGGDVFTLIALRRGLSMEKDFGRILELAAEISGRPALVSVKPSSQPRTRWPDIADVWASLATEDRAGLTYLESRALEGAIAAGLARFNTGKTSKPWLNGKAKEGYRVVVPMYSTQGTIHTLQLRSIEPGVSPGDSKKSCPWAYPDDGVAMGNAAAAPSSPRVYLAEGIADTLALQLAGVVTIGAPGTGSLKKLLGFLGTVRGREIVLCPQNDAKHQSQLAFAEVKQRLHRLGAKVLDLITPAPHKDPAEWRKAVGPEAFRAAVAAGAPPEAPSRDVGADDDDEGPVYAVTGGAALRVVPMPEKDPRPEIVVSPDEQEVNDRAIVALKDDETLFERDHLLVHVVREEAPKEGAPAPAIRRPPFAPRIMLANPATLRERLSARILWKKYDERSEELKRAHPPTWAVSGIFSRGHWPPLRRLTGVVEAPVMRADGSIINEPGYDVATGLLYQPNGKFLKVADSPTRELALEALAELKGVFCDFPFAKDEHRSTLIAALLTPLARQAFDDCAPLFLFDANVSGSGKSLLTDVIANVVQGRNMARMSATDDDEEMRKRITTMAIAGDPIVLIDNIENGGSLGGPTLDMALTADEYRDRLLGQNTELKTRLRMIWFATGNNVQLRGDMQRRVLHCRLESPMERPTERESFRHSPLLPWVRAERPRLLRAALTVLRAHAVAGRPKAAGLTALGSFEAWSLIVRGALLWLGEPDPALTQRELATTSDNEVAILADVLAGWEELDDANEGLTVREALHKLELNPKIYGLLRSTLEELCPPRAGKPATSQAVSKKLQRFKGRFISGKALDHLSYDDHLKSARWGIRRAP